MRVGLLVFVLVGGFAALAQAPERELALTFSSRSPIEHGPSRWLVIERGTVTLSGSNHGRQEKTRKRKLTDEETSSLRKLMQAALDSGTLPRTQPQRHKSRDYPVWTLYLGPVTDVAHLVAETVSQDEDIPPAWYAFLHRLNDMAEQDSAP